ncbi:hypothetical protein D6V10_20975, partial [Vibrio cholerae]|nr:hypothetical protein [Vibrio cholerae]
FSDSHASEVLADLGRSPPAKPTFDMDISHLFHFASDPRDQGLNEKWYAPAYGVQWRPIRMALSWEQQGYPGYHGVGWYR